MSVERETFPDLIAAGATVLGYAEAAYWLDVGTPEAFVQGSCDLVLGALPGPAVPIEQAAEKITAQGETLHHPGEAGFR